MTQPIPRSCTAFAGERRIATGGLMHVAMSAKTLADHDPDTPILVFDDDTSRLVELDLRGSLDDVRERVAARLGEASKRDAGDRSDGGTPRPKRGRGRPKLGVVSGEVTLLPRHWAWLKSQRGGASATLRRLVEAARRQEGGATEARRAQDAAYRFMSATVGNQPGFEEATRALFRGEPEKFDAESVGWPADLRAHARRLADAALQRSSA